MELTNINKLADNNMEEVREDIQNQSHLGAANIKKKNTTSSNMNLVTQTFDILLKKC
jgi:hypothetical protein